MRSMTTALLAGALLLCASTGSAEDRGPSEFAREGGYILLSGLAAFDLFREDKLEDKNSVRSASVDPGWGLGARAGWRHHPYVATELQIDVVVDRDVTANGRNNETREIASSFNLKVPFLTNRVQPYAIAGVGLFYSKIANTTKNDSVNFMFRGGLGLDVYVTEHWVVNTEAAYVLPAGKGPVARDQSNISGLDTIALALGFAYRF